MDEHSPHVRDFVCTRTRSVCTHAYVCVSLYMYMYICAYCYGESCLIISWNWVTFIKWKKLSNSSLYRKLLKYILKYIFLSKCVFHKLSVGFVLINVQALLVINVFIKMSKLTNMNLQKKKSWITLLSWSKNQLISIILRKSISLKNHGLYEWYRDIV